jgi:hypothetical protein
MDCLGGNGRKTALNMKQNCNYNRRHGHEQVASLKNLLFAMVINSGIVGRSSWTT